MPAHSRTHRCPPDHSHKLTCYVTHKCGCATCRAVNARYARWRRSVLKAGLTTGGHDVPIVGTLRRIRALNRLGWSTPAICRHAGLGSRGRDKFAQNFVHVRTAAAIRRAYDDLWDQLPPETNRAERVSVSRTRNHAERLGWPAPLDWDDETIDDPDATPHAGTLALKGQDA